MKRRILVALLAVLMMSGTLGAVQHTAAQGGGCKAFGQNVAELVRLRAQLVFGEGLEIVGDLVDLVHERPQLLRLTLVTVTKNF